MDIDLPWHYDPQREHPEKRRFFFEWFESELIRKKANYVIVHGSHKQRLQNAIQTVNQMLG
jgi:nicotinamide riboside kinase